MSDQVLTLMKFGLLALLYLFFARILWAVWSEVRSATTVAAVPAGTSSRSQKRGRSKEKRRSSAPIAPAPMTPAAPSIPSLGMDSDPAAFAGGSGALPAGVLRVVEPEAQAGMTYTLGKELTIGRAPGCGILVDDTFVSQLHTRVWSAAGTWMVEDLGSTNGTIFNGDALTEPRVMNMGDQIRVGSTVLELQ